YAVAVYLNQTERYPEAIATFKDVVTACQWIVDNDKSGADWMATISSLNRSIAGAFGSAGQFQDELDVLVRAQKIDEQRALSSSGSDGARLDMALDQQMIGNLLASTKHFDQALPAERHAVALLEDVAGRHPG